MLFRIVLLLLLGAQLSACSIGYYYQATTGHLELMRLRRPVDQVLADPETSPEVVDLLETADAALAFAHADLQLPDNGSYRQFADLQRPYAVWNVVAAPGFSLEPVTWCFPVAGCVAYRGDFRERDARQFAARLHDQGLDVYVGGATAYSTLGRFADPLLNTMAGLPASRLSGLIFHELAHQQLYAKGDTRFSEGFASFVEQEGLRRWRRSGNAAIFSWEDQCAADLRRTRRHQVLAVLDHGRQRLAQLYAAELPDNDKQSAKAAVFAAMIDRYRALRDRWGGPPFFDGWFDAGLNNAKLAALAAYDDYVPAFQAMLAEVKGDLRAFYARAAAVAALPPAERAAEMDRLASGREVNAVRPVAGTCRDRIGN